MPLVFYIIFTNSKTSLGCKMMSVYHRKIRVLGLLLLVITFFVAYSFGQTTREDIIASREKRKFQLGGVLENIHKKLADHHSGRKTLGEKQLAHLEHKVNAYQHQIEELDRELDEDEIQRRIERAIEIQRAKENQEL